MGLPRKVPKTSALLVAAIRKLRNIHGSTSREITNYIASGCDGPTKNIKRQMKLALRRGISNGALHRSKDGYYTCAAFDDSEVPGERSRGRCGRRRKSRRRRSCGKKRRRSSCGKKRRRKRKCGKRRHRRRRGSKCGRRRRRSSCRRTRRKRKCGGRRHDDGVEVDALVAGRKSVRKQRQKSKNASKSSSQMRVSSASSGGTQRSGADTLSATLSASGKESLSDHSDISRTSDGTRGETKP